LQSIGLLVGVFSHGHIVSVAKKFWPAVILLLTLAPPAYSQTFGLKIGYPVSSVFQGMAADPRIVYSSHSRPVKVGLTAEIAIQAGLLLEIDALYSRLSYAATDATNDPAIRFATTVNSWDVPVLVKKEFTKFRIKPFIDGGVDFRAANVDTAVNGSDTNANGGKIRTLEFVHQISPGLAAGAGIDIKFGRFHLIPEYRYARFERPNLRAPVGTFQSNLKQPAILLGIQVGK